MSQPPEKSKAEPASAAEREKILAEVLEDQRAREEARARKRPPPRTADAPFFAQIGLLLASTLFFYLLFFSPAWIAPAAAPPIAAERQADNLRFYVGVLARQVDQHHAAEGRVPESLEELAGVREGTTYQPLSAGRYRIGVTSGDVEVVYDSSQDLQEFIGRAADRILGTATGDATRAGET